MWCISTFLAPFSPLSPPPPPPSQAFAWLDFSAFTAGEESKEWNSIFTVLSKWFLNSTSRQNYFSLCGQIHTALAHHQTVSNTRSLLSCYIINVKSDPWWPEEEEEEEEEEVDSFLDLLQASKELVLHCAAAIHQSFSLILIFSCVRIDLYSFEFYPLSLSLSHFHSFTSALWRQKFEAIVAERLQRLQPLWALAVMENHITRSPLLHCSVRECTKKRAPNHQTEMAP